MADLQGQVIPNPSLDVPVIVVGDEVNAHRGRTAKLLAKPSGKRLLVLMADNGNFRARLGDKTGAGEMPSTYIPESSVTDGSGGVFIPEGRTVTLHAPANITVKGYTDDAVLTYYYL